MGPKITASEANLSRERQIIIALTAIIGKGGCAQMQHIYEAVEEHMSDAELSIQGKASLRELINRVAVKRGYIHAHTPKNPGWRITLAGKEFIKKSSRW